MKQEKSKQQRIWGAVFIALAVLLYALVFAGSAFKQPAVGKVRERVQRLSVHSEMMQAVPAKHLAKIKDSPAMKIVAQANLPPALCLLFVGLAWILNPQRKVGIWLYRLLTVYFALTGAMFLAALYMTKSGAKPSYLAAATLVGLVFLGAAALFFWRAGKLAKQEKSIEATAPAAGALTAEPSSPASSQVKAAARSGRKRYHACNIFHLGADRRQVWQFDARGGDYVLGREQTAAGNDKLPSSLFTKTWSWLWQPKLNVAWLPPESVFLRVVHLPTSNLEETLSMVELQLERLSPIPVTQAVWSVQLLPQGKDNLQTVVVLFVERKSAEEFLGQLEGQDYLADRLEIPALDQLQAVSPTGDGAWIFPELIGGHNSALVAWWSGGVLQNLDLLALPATGDRATAVRQQLTQIAWAGELEGWLAAPPTWHLVAGEAVAAEWEPILRQGLDEPVELLPPASPAELAGLTARRATGPNAASNLLPAEFATRYQQRFVDRLWMRGLMAIVGLYLVGVAIYMLALGVLHFQTRSVEKEVAENSLSYTNAIQLRDRYKVLKERQELKFAALDCWKAVADVLPNEITLEGFNFSDGRKLLLNGTAGNGQDKAVLDFNEAMRNTLASGQPLFDKKGGDPLTYGTGPGGNVSWRFSLELKRAELQ